MIGTIQKFDLGSSQWGKAVFFDKSILADASFDPAPGIDLLRQNSQAFVSAQQSLLTAGRIATDGSLENAIKRVYFVSGQDNSIYVFQLFNDEQWAAIQGLPAFEQFNEIRVDLFARLGWEILPLKTVDAFPAGVVVDELGQPTLDWAAVTEMYGA